MQSAKCKVQNAKIKESGSEPVALAPAKKINNKRRGF
jgi:hypothetical protein